MIQIQYQITVFMYKLIPMMKPYHAEHQIYMMGDANYEYNMVVILITTQLIHDVLAGTECT